MRVLAGLDHAHHAGDSVERRAGDLVDRRLDRCLHLGLQRRANQIAAACNLLLADAGPREVLHHIVTEETVLAGGDAATWKLVRLGQNAQWLGHSGAQLIGLLRKILDHGVQHDISPLQRAFGIGVGVEQTRRLHQSRQQRGLLPIQLRGVDAEVGLRGILNAERAVAEKHQVEVTGQNLRFAERLVERQRHPDLAQLARRRQLDSGPPLGVGLCRHQQLIVLHVLLLDRRAPASAGVAGEVAGKAGQRALPVHAVVLGESLILDRDDRQLHRVGNLVGRHLEPALRVQPRDRVAGRVDHRRHLRDVALYKLRGAVGDDVGGTVGHQPDAAGEREHQRRRHHSGQDTASRQPDDGYQSRPALQHSPRLSAAPRQIGCIGRSVSPRASRSTVWISKRLGPSRDGGVPAAVCHFPGGPASTVNWKRTTGFPVVRSVIVIFLICGETAG